MNYELNRQVLHFRQPAGTSRGVYTTRTVWYVTLIADDGRRGVGECAPLPDLSCDYGADYEDCLHAACTMTCQMGRIPTDFLREWPSILFGLECAMLQLEHGDVPADADFAAGRVGIPINGLIWMGSYDEMHQRIEEKLAAGFHCVKLKIGAINHDDELKLLRMIRAQYGRDQIELRVDANGAFQPEEAMQRLEQLAELDLHSIEQPIRQGQWPVMADLCSSTPLPVALDEELIGVNLRAEKVRLLDTIRPQYIVLKPSLHGGLSGCREWISMARERGIGWWVTSALESNVGLGAIARWCSTLHPTMPQGLGTGLLFTDNTEPSTEIRGERLYSICR